MKWRSGWRSTIAAFVAVALCALGIAAPGATTASRPPVLVGFLDQERGANSFPEYGAAARAARDYINSKLDGINGRELKFVECSTDGSPEASINCANTFVHAKVGAVLMGIDIGSDAALPILTAARIPFVAHLAIGSAQSVSKQAFFFGSPIQAWVAAPLKVMAQRLHVKSVAFITQGNIVARTSLVPKGLVPAAKHLNLKLTTVYFDPANPDYAQAVTTALAARPDALFFSGSEPDCSSLIAAIRQLRFGGLVFASGCTAFIAADPQAAEGVFSNYDLWIQSASAAAPKAKVAELNAFAAQMKKAAPQYATSGGAQRTFAATMDTANVLRAIKGDITSAAVLKQLRATRNLPGFMGQPINCDGKQWPGQRTACAGGILVYRVERGVLRPFSHGFVYAKDIVGP
jgi:branched-chain amino acid transport system substrate-binding protein